MKNFSLFINAKLLLAMFAVLTLASVAFGAEPTRPDREADDVRRPLPSDQKPGSVLVYNIYASSAADPGKQDTDVSMTNLNTTQPAFVHIFFIADGCSTADAYICLTPKQTVSFLTSSVDPGVKGYIIAFTTDDKGCPNSFNYMIGSEYVKFETGHAANLGAEAYAALYNGTLPGCTNSTVSTRIPLDGVRYNAAPRILAVDKIPSVADNNSTMLIINTLEGDLAIGMTPIRTFGGNLYDDAENGVAYTATAVCQFRQIMGQNTFPRTGPPFQQFIPAGRTGWMTVMAQEERAISGAVINFNPDAATKKGAFNGGHNLPHLRLAGGGFLVPVFPPTC